MPRFGENRQPPLRSRGGFSEIERANDRDDDTESSVGYDSDNWIQDAGDSDYSRSSPCSNARVDVDVHGISTFARVARGSDGVA